MAAPESLEELVDQQLLVELTDGRVVRGRAYCFDPQGSIVLADAVRLPLPHESRTQLKELGLVLILKDRRSRVCILRPVEDTTSMMSNLSVR